MNAFQEFNHEILESEFRPCENWSQSAIDQCNRLINGDDEATVLKMLFNIREKRKNHFFGDLCIEVLPKNRTTISTTDFGNALVSISHAIRVEFHKGLHISFVFLDCIIQICIILINLIRFFRYWSNCIEI